jgi:hypothetical protein
MSLAGIRRKTEMCASNRITMGGAKGPVRPSTRVITRFWRKICMRCVTAVGHSRRFCTPDRISVVTF